MKLTRKQEVKLIEVGLNKILNDLIGIKIVKKIKTKKIKKNKGFTGKKWTKKQREKFIKTMQEKWKNKRKSG